MKARVMCSDVTLLCWGRHFAKAECIIQWIACDPECSKLRRHVPIGQYLYIIKKFKIIIYNI